MSAKGWAESIYGTGIRCDHKVSCLSSRDRRRGRRCKCTYSFWAVIDGKRTRITGVASRAKARRLKAFYEARSAGRGDVSKRVVTPLGEAHEPVKAHFARWMRWGTTSKPKKWSPATVTNREKAWRQCIEGQLDQLPVSSITPTLLEDWIERNLAAGLGYRSVEHGFETMRAMLGRLAKRRVIDWNPALVVDFPAQPEPDDDRAGERDYLLPSEYRQLLNSLTDLRSRVIVRLATEGAMRRGEVCAVRWDVIDFDASPCLVTIARTIVRDEKVLVEKSTKGESLRAASLRDDEVRVAALSSHAVSDLLAYREELRSRGAYDPNGRVLPSGRAYRDVVNPTDPSALTRWCTRTMKAAGLVREDGSNRFSLQDLRRTGATLAREGGVSEDVIRDQLGHSDTGISRQAYIRNRVNPHIASFADVFEQIGNGDGR